MARCTPWLSVLALSCALAATSAPALADQQAALALPASSCSSSPYAYAGLFASAPSSGIEATLTTLAAAQVPAGHVAGWIGVGGVNSGPGGQAEWLQAGVATDSGAGSELYSEIALPGRSPQYLELSAQADPGSSFRIAVVQLRGRPDTWQVLVDGRPATAPVFLPGSGGFAPMAMSESWDGGTQTCNGFAYRFSQMRVVQGRSWQSMRNPSVIADLGYEVTNRTPGGFTALSA